MSKRATATSSRRRLWGTDGGSGECHCKNFAAGKGPTKSQLQDWLVSGTQVQKDEAAAVFYGISHGVVAKDKKKLARKEAAIKAALLAEGGHTPESTSGPTSRKTTPTSLRPGP